LCESCVIYDVVLKSSNGKSYIDFEENAIGDFDLNNSLLSFGKVSGTFKCNKNGYLIPALNSALPFQNLSTKGSYFKVSEIETTSDIV